MANFKKLLVIFLLNLIILELLAFLFLNFSRLGKIFYKHKVPNKKEFLTALGDINGRLGWPLGEQKARVKKNKTPCISTFGDSYTFGSGVKPEESWPEKLQVLLGCPVENWGIGGYGTDQAFLRYGVLKKKNMAKGKILLLVPHENILRIQNQFRGYLYPKPFPETDLRFKPRFILKDSKLKLIPIPVKDILIHSLKNKDFKFLKHEGISPLILEFPYSKSAFNAFLGQRVQAKIRAKIWYEDSFKKSSRPFNLMREIIIAFNQLAQLNKQQFKVFFLPHCKDFMGKRRDRVLSENLVEELKKKGVFAKSLKKDLLNQFNGQKVQNFFLSCSGHYNQQGNAAIARSLSRYF